MNKDTMMIVAVVVALLATFYLYRETNKNKLDIQKLMDPAPLPQAVITPPKSILKKEKVQVPATSTTMVADDVEQ